MRNKETYSNILNVVALSFFVLGMMFYNAFPGGSFWTYCFFLLSGGLFVVYGVLRFKHLRGSFRRRGFRKGLGDVIVMLLSVAALLLVYLILRHYPVRYDMTEEHRFSLSKQSLDVLKELKQNIVIKVLAQKSSADPQTVELLKVYDGESDRVRVEYIPHLSNPQVFQQYNVPYQNGEGVGALVIEKDGETSGTPGKYFVVSPRDLYQQSFDPNTQRPSQTYQGETRITSVLASLDTEGFDTVILGYTSGHGEADFSDSGPMGLSQVASALSLEHYELKKMNLLTVDAIPSEVKLVIVPGAKKPLQSVENDRIMKYLERGGALLYLGDPAVQAGPSSVNELTKRWNIRAEDSLLIEGHPEYTATLLGVNGLLTLHLPNYTQHDVVKRLQENQLTTAFIYSMGFVRDAKEDKKFAVEDIIQTSDDSWLEKGGAPNRFDQGIDTKGPISFGVSVVENIEKGSGSTAHMRVIFLGDSDFIRNSFANIGPFDNNKDFFLNCIAWLTQQKQNITVRPKELKRRDLLLTAQGVSIIFYVTVVFIPLSIIVTGVYVYNRRRRRNELG